MTDHAQPSPTEETPSEAELDYIALHLDDLRRAVEGRTILYWWLLLGFLLGLIAHLAGYFIGAATSNTVVTLLADLLRSLGTALWTGCVLILFVQVWPDVQQRGARRRFALYEKALRDRDAREKSK
jgi:putative copper export protein